MKLYRVSMATMMGAVATAALDFWVMRSLDPGSPDMLPHFLFATGVMPVASLLMLVGLISAPRLFRSGELSSFVIGFEALGWTAVFAFVTCYSIATKTFMEGAEAVAATCRPFLIDYLKDLPAWAGWAFEFGFASILFSLPQLLLALLGGWLAHRVGITARFALANWGAMRAANLDGTASHEPHFDGDPAARASEEALLLEIRAEQ